MGPPGALAVPFPHPAVTADLREHAVAFATRTQKGQPKLPSLVPRTVAQSAGYEGFLSVAISARNIAE
jgi:hypothetical protein